MELLVSGSVVSNLRFFWEGENGIVTLLKKSQYALFSYFFIIRIQLPLWGVISISAGFSPHDKVKGVWETYVQWHLSF